MNRALLVGINSYPGHALSGPVNDVAAMSEFLVASCGFSRADIRLLVDSRATKNAIVEQLGWLVSGLQKGDRVLFHYSGHGTRIPTRNSSGDVTQLDEAILAVNFDWPDKNCITDREFEAVFKSVPQGVRFIWIVDSCYSGGLLTSPTAKKIRTISPPPDIHWRIETAKKKGLSPVGFAGRAGKFNVALIAACRANQASGDEDFNGHDHGVLTYFLLAELKKTGGLKQPLSSLIKQVTKQVKPYNQEPELEGAEYLKAKPFLAVS